MRSSSTASSSPSARTSTPDSSSRRSRPSSGRPTARGWFEGETPHDVERLAAIKRLTDSGLIEAAPPPDHFRVTAEGWEFLQDVRAKVGAAGSLDWTRVDEIDFSKL